MHETHLQVDTGKVVRLGPNEYSINDVDALRTIYGPATRFIKAPWYSAFDEPSAPHSTIFSMKDIKAHGQERRKYATAYSMSTMLSYEMHVDQCIEILDQRFREFSSTKELINFGHWMQCYAFDFSKRFGFLDRGHDIENLISSLDAFNFYGSLVGIIPEWHRFLFPLINFFKQKTGLRYLFEFGRAAIKERKQDSDRQDGPSDFATKFMEASAESSKFTDLNTLRGCMANIIAGSDTTSATLNSILFRIYGDSSCLQRLRDEIDQFPKQGGMTQPISYKESLQMPYLQACIKEGLRIHPATGLPLFRLVPPGGATIAGVNFPAGAVVGINSWVAHHDSDVFGPDPGVFRPERWIATNAEDKDRISTLDRYFMPFGHGARTCLGKNISYLEINKVVPWIVQNFDLQIRGGTAEDSRFMKAKNYFFVKQSEFQGTLTLRGLHD
ncbi:hypothetical protein PFICI_09592 [Pestalotiopsis fici W106-1]|uniref:Pisatin demethylase n=1 Tax=Pestalotiopsis fici (strain W106-1 / CGMCC3.15140) TaxID=1229662 RepID=W3X163_PESFW|nr:uncharacterized protein PFICI_09592 [Pestalotiopsis fici W106-1]ETS79739.1 hypothetical protein PFICI_09592 [Pestalotiopsis fici W106-1]